MTANFDKTGWPEKAPKSKEERREFIASLHKRKTELFMVLIEKKLLPLRPGVAKYLTLSFLICIFFTLGQFFVYAYQSIISSKYFLPAALLLLFFYF